jgi:hypothetical protein
MGQSTDVAIKPMPGEEVGMNEAPFVERKFELDGADLAVRFYQPEKAPGGEFQCRWTVAWPEGLAGRYARGEDGVQALLLAMRSVQLELVESDYYKSGKLTLYGQADLDLPPTWGAGSLYDVPPPSDGPSPGTT